MVTVFTAIAGVFITSGFTAALIQDKDARDIDFTTIFYCSLLVSAVLYVVLFISAPMIGDFYGEPELVLIIRVYSIMFPISALNSVQGAYVSRHMMFKKMFWATLVGTLASGALGIAMALAGFGVWALVAQGLASVAIGTLTMLAIVPWRPSLGFSRASARTHLGFGLRILAADLIGTICNNLRPLILGKFYSANDLAYFNRGQSFPDLIANNVSVSLSAVLFPAMSNVSDAASEVRSLLRRAVRIVSYIMFPLFVGLIAVADPLVRVLLTDKWVECVPFLQLVALTRLVEVASGQNLQALKAMGRGDVVLRLEFVKKPVFVASLVYAATIDVMAIAISWPLYALFAAVVNILPNRRILGYGVLDQARDVAAPLLLSGAMGLCMWAMSMAVSDPLQKLIAECFVGLAAYFGLSAAFHVDSFTYLKNAVRGYMKVGSVWE